MFRHARRRDVVDVVDEGGGVQGFAVPCGIGPAGVSIPLNGQDALSSEVLEGEAEAPDPCEEVDESERSGRFHRTSADMALLTWPG